MRERPAALSWDWDSTKPARRVSRGFRVILKIVSGENQVGTSLPWRGLAFVLAALGLFIAALWLTNHGQPFRALACLGAAFSVAMAWMVLAAREAKSADTLLRSFVVRIASWLALGTSVLGIYWWSADHRITLMEAGFAALYMAAAFVAIRILDSKPRNPSRLAAVRGGSGRTRESG